MMNLSYSVFSSSTPIFDVGIILIYLTSVGLFVQEEGAVYWDDPDHLQAAPDRSSDEPEPEAMPANSSLRSALKGGTATFGKLRSWDSSSGGGAISIHIMLYIG